MKDKKDYENLEKKDKHYFHKAFLVFCGWMLLYQFIAPHIQIAKFTDWQAMLISVFGQIINVAIGYVFTLLIRIKSENLKILLTFIISTTLDVVFEFEFVFDFSLVNIVLLTVMAVILLLNALNYIFNKPIKTKISKIVNETKRKKFELMYLLISLILLFGLASLIIVHCVLYYSNHPFRWTTIEPTN